MKEKIAIICGGDTSEFEVSLRSAQGLYDAMDKTLFEPHIVIFRGTHWFLRTGDGNEVEMDKNDFSAMVGGRRIAFRYAYVTIHGTPGEDGRLQGYLDMMRIKYSTGGVLSLALTHDKYPCNQYLRAFGIPVAASVCLYEGQAADCADILAVTGLPCFVKPSLGGSSYGISKVKTADKLPAALDKAFHESDKVVVEACLVGTELTCGAYKTRKTQRAFPVTEVVTHNEFFDYDAKYNGQVDEITPARISEDRERPHQGADAADIRPGNGARHHKGGLYRGGRRHALRAGGKHHAWHDGHLVHSAAGAGRRAQPDRRADRNYHGQTGRIITKIRIFVAHRHPVNIRKYDEGKNKKETGRLYAGTGAVQGHPSL